MSKSTTFESLRGNTNSIGYQEYLKQLAASSKTFNPSTVPMYSKVDAVKRDLWRRRMSAYEMCLKNPTKENVQSLDVLQNEYDAYETYINYVNYVRIVKPINEAKAKIDGIIADMHGLYTDQRLRLQDYLKLHRELETRTSALKDLGVAHALISDVFVQMQPASKPSKAARGGAVVQEAQPQLPTEDTEVTEVTTEEEDPEQERDLMFEIEDVEHDQQEEHQAQDTTDEIKVINIRDKDMVVRDEAPLAQVDVPAPVVDASNSAEQINNTEDGEGSDDGLTWTTDDEDFVSVQ